MHFLSMSLADLLSGWQPGATLLFLHRPENRSSNYSALSALSVVCSPGSHRKTSADALFLTHLAKMQALVSEKS